MIYNEGLPQDLGFVKRNTPESYLRLELDTEFIGNARAIGKKHLSRIVEASFRTGKAPKASYVLDAMKERGYKYSTLAALTTSVFDMKIPEEKEEIIDFYIPTYAPFFFNLFCNSEMMLLSAHLSEPTM